MVPTRQGIRLPSRRAASRAGYFVSLCGIAHGIDVVAKGAEQ